MRILFLGDIFGKPGRKIVKNHLEWLREELRADVVIANGENAAAGKGITPRIANELFTAGIDLMSLGNHAYDNKEVFDLFESGEDRVVRPLNYAKDSPGPYSTRFAVNGQQVTLVQLIGRVYMPPVDSPFEAIDHFLRDAPHGPIVVDIHCEATSEKQALAWYLDGRVTAVIGTHTHVQSADERILPEGTAAITDVGMTGPHDGIIGGDKNAMMRRFLTQLPTGLEVAKGDPKIHAVVVETRENDRLAQKIERYSLAESDLNKGILE
ncbi:MAG: TIGR00282 family metallophosphoesterase [Candidatus Omnitrophica bacterium]|nr:TIGR00282 family metallophosphoesterase [Candidatus Omnitrophota bacterium]MCB9770602.1 TIGR00282 family metallophosphoesterase [Candidatus Omnitrophota bacterium]MCB9781798.1 TIGR00282 family metallophosphoesterase [Candidatus Omnitrophota bacterium]